MRAETIAKALGGRKVGDGWMARCPAHEDRHPSLSIHDADDGKVLVCCHAGCDQARVMEALRTRALWSNRPQDPLRAIRATRYQARTDVADRDDDKRTEAAMRIWREARRLTGTLVEVYLRTRGITLSVMVGLRFHATLKHPSGTIWPAMVGLVRRGANGDAMAVHRTFLARDGRGKAPFEPQKMMLGPCRGGAVRLAPAAELLMVGEGIETCLAAMQAIRQPAWAALSTSGLRSLDLPPEVCEVIVLADGDQAGEAAARDAALRWKRQGRRVRIARPPQGRDFNDLLLGRAPQHVEGAA